MSKPIVELSEGKIQGIIGQNFNGDKIYKFLGVPYAKPPINELRFKAPQPVEKWNGIKDATKDGNASHQVESSHEFNDPVQSEDCLVLNVFTRDISPVNNLKPVMVYIFGGAFIVNSNSSEVYGPELLLMEDVVIVVMNYRLGLLGFLCLEDESLDVPGNAALKDQTMALKWVQRNIKVFGGDPNNVTLFGESSGAMCVHLHVLSQASKGLFHKAIIQSGVVISAEPAGLLTKCIAEVLGKKGATDREILSILKNMTGKEILAVQEKVPQPLTCESSRLIGPIIEKSNPSAFLTRHPFEVITSGDYNHVTLFIGYTSEEGTVLEMFRKLRPELANQYNFRLAIPYYLETNDEQNFEIERLMSSFYSNENESLNKHMVMMDSQFLSPIVAAIIHHVKTSKSPVYVFRIAVDGQRNYLKHFYGLQEFKGACHADEIGYLWNIKMLPKIQLNSLEHLIVQKFVRLWTDFATFGNPTQNYSEVNLLPVKEGNHITVLNIDKDLTVLKDVPERERVELWKKIHNVSKTTNYLKI